MGAESESEIAFDFFPNEIHCFSSSEMWCGWLKSVTQNVICKITITKNKTDEEQEIIQGIFSLKYLSIFTKCTNLSNNVELYLKNNYPIILRYTIASLGEIKLCLSQQDITQ